MDITCSLPHWPQDWRWWAAHRASRKQVHWWWIMMFYFTVNMMLFVISSDGEFANWFCSCLAHFYFHTEWSECSVFLADSLQCFQLKCSIHEQVLTFPYLKHWEEYCFSKIALTAALQREFCLSSLHSVISIKIIRVIKAGISEDIYFFPHCSENFLKFLLKSDLHLWKNNYRPYGQFGKEESCMIESLKVALEGIQASIY